MATIYDAPAVIYDDPCVTYDGLTIADYPGTAQVLSAEIRIGGVLVASPAFSERTDSTPFVDAQANTWTMEDGAAIACPAPFASPIIDPAPWYDAAVPESADFAGLLVLGVSGLDDRPTSREVVPALTGGGVLTRRRTNARTITVTGVLLGSSCCGVTYGLKWLGQALDGCGEPGCDGVDAEVFACCPSDDETFSTFQDKLRTIRRVALLSGPDVTRTAGDGCRSGCTADVIFVEFILAAAEPWLWTQACTLLLEDVPTDEGACIEWNAVASGTTTCRHGCDPASSCTDPSCVIATPPSMTTGTLCYCSPLATNQECFDLDTSSFPASFEAMPIITFSAGSSDLRRVTIQFYEKTGADCTCDTLDPCDIVSVYHAGYVPAGGTLTFDGQIRKATVTCEGETQPANAWGDNGAPIGWESLGCGKDWCVKIVSDALSTPAADASVTIALSGRDTP